MVKPQVSPSFHNPYRKRWKDLHPSLQLRHQRLRAKLRDLLKEIDPEARRDVIPLLRKGGHKTPITQRIPWFPIDITPNQDAEGEGSMSIDPDFSQDGLDEKLLILKLLQKERSKQILQFFKPLHLNLLEHQRSKQNVEIPKQNDKDEEIKILKLIIQDAIKTKSHDWEHSVYQLRKRLNEIVGGNPEVKESKLEFRVFQHKRKPLNCDPEDPDRRIQNISKIVAKLRNLELSMIHTKKTWMFVPEISNLVKEYRAYEEKYLSRGSTEENQEKPGQVEQAPDSDPLPQPQQPQSTSTSEEIENNNDQSNHSESSSVSSHSENKNTKRTILTLKPSIKPQTGTVFTSDKTNHKYTFVPACQTVLETTLRLLTASYALKAQCDNLTLTEKKTGLTSDSEKVGELKPSARSKRKSTADRSSNFYSGGFNKFVVSKKEEQTLCTKAHSVFEAVEEAEASELQNGTMEYDDTQSTSGNKSQVPLKPSEHSQSLTNEEVGQRLDLTFLGRDQNLDFNKLKQIIAGKLAQPMQSEEPVSSLSLSFSNLARLARENGNVKSLNWSELFEQSNCKHCQKPPPGKLVNITKNCSNENGLPKTTDDDGSSNDEDEVSEFTLENQFSHTIKGFEPDQTSIPRIPNPIVEHTIDLQQYKLELEQRLEQLINDRTATTFKLPEYPEMKRLIKKVKVQIQNQNKEPLVSTVPMEESSLKISVTLALCNMLAELGFTHMQLPAMDILAEVLERHCQNICSKLNQAHEKSAFGAPDGFIDPMDRVLHDLGINGIEGIMEFYKTRVLKYHDYLESDVRNLESKIASGFYHHFKTMTEKSSSSSATTPKQKPSTSLRRGPMSPGFSK